MTALKSIPGKLITEDGKVTILRPRTKKVQGSRLEAARKRFKGYTLLQLLEEISVFPVDEMDNQPDLPKGWYAVINDEGIIAYMASAEEALHYRLDFINRILNS